MTAKKLQEHILNLLALSAETLEQLSSYNRYPYIYSAFEEGEDSEKQREKINSAVGDLIKNGLVEEVESGTFQLTTAGAELKKSLYWSRRRTWDGRWRVVIFDIPEKQRQLRDDLRLELKKLGFGCWQRSVWVTPFDFVRELQRFLEQNRLSEDVQIIVGERFGELPDRDFAAEIWPLDSINEKYKKLLESWEAELKKESTNEERLHTARTLHNRYIDILVADPQLPAELLPLDWKGDKAAMLFEKLRSILALGKPF
jgi:phenylacetic acid degradation operon negative regulatory protein